MAVLQNRAAQFDSGVQFFCIIPFECTQVGFTRCPVRLPDVLKSRTKIILGTVVSVCLLGVVALLFFWVRRRRPNSDPESPSRITTFSGAPPSGSLPILPPMPGKASDARQRYLQQELRAVQEKIVDVDDMERQMLTDQGSRNRNGSILRRNLDTATSQLDAARAHNDQLIARIQELEVQMQSSWALGLSDEAPPGYTA